LLLFGVLVTVRDSPVDGLIEFILDVTYLSPILVSLLSTVRLLWISPVSITLKLSVSVTVAPILIFSISQVLLV